MKNLSPDRILYENRCLFVLNKRCGEDSEFPAAKGIFPVHRLDRPVSGCQLFAKDRKSAAYLGGLFADQLNFASPDRKIVKKYWAIVEKPEGTFSGGSDFIELNHWINFDSRKNKSRAALEKTNPSAKEARLRYRFTGEGANYLFMEIDLLTGRHHQIRAQLAAAGFHVKGDLKYGAKRSEKTGGIRLHASFLSFPNPEYREETISADAPVEPDALWQAFLESVR